MQAEKNIRLRLLETVYNIAENIKKDDELNSRQIFKLIKHSCDAEM